MYTKGYLVYGAPGHRQKEAFRDSCFHDFSEGENTRKIEILNADRTGHYDFSVLIVTRNTKQECIVEAEGQIFDGAFENLRVGKVQELTLEGVEKYRNMKVYKFFEGGHFPWQQSFTKYVCFETLKEWLKWDDLEPDDYRDWYNTENMNDLIELAERREDAGLNWRIEEVER